MIDDDLVRAHRARALDPEQPFVRGTAHNPDTFFQARETVNPFYAALPGIVQAAMDRFAALTGRQYHLFDYDGPADAERVVVLMGSGAETARETAAALRAARREGRRAAGAPVPSVRRRCLPRRAAGVGARDRGAGADQGAGRRRRTAVPGRRRHAGAGGRARRARRHAARRRRPLRPVVEGFPAGAGQGGVRRTGEAASAHRLHARHHRRRRRTPASIRTGLSAVDPPGTGRGGVLRPRRRRHGRRQQEQREDHRRGCRPARAGLFRLRQPQIGRADGLASALRAAPDPHALPDPAGELRRLPPVQLRRAAWTCCASPRPAPRSCSTARTARTRCGTSCRAPCSSASSTCRLRFFVIDASRVAQDVGLRGRTNTILQTCFFAISGVLPRDEAIEQIKNSIEKTYGAQGRRRGAAQLPGGRRHARAPARSARARRRHQHLGTPAAGAGQRARLRAPRDRPHDGRAAATRFRSA